MVSEVLNRKKIQSVMIACSDCNTKFRYLDFLCISSLPPFYTLKCRHCFKHLKVSPLVHSGSSLVCVIIWITIMFSGGMVLPSVTSESGRIFILLFFGILGFLIGFYMQVLILISWIRKRVAES